MLVAGPVAGMIGHRFGSKWALAGGMLVVSFAALLFAVAHGEPWHVLVASGLLGLGVGSAFASMAALIADNVDALEMGVAGGMNTVVRMIGAVIGGQVGAALLTAQTIGSTSIPAESAFTTAFVLSAVTALVASGIAVSIGTQPLRSRLEPVAGALALTSRVVDADAVEIRVLGCLIEKQRTTPDQYPLSLNALRLACNQATNRDPVVDYDEATIRAALEKLSRRGWVRLASGPGGRVAKYRHLLDEALGRVPSQIALLGVLMLRGAQTPGELKSRVERLYPFGSLEDVQRDARPARRARARREAAAPARPEPGPLRAAARRRRWRRAGRRDRAFDERRKC